MVGLVLPDIGLARLKLRISTAAVMLESADELRAKRNS